MHGTTVPLPAGGRHVTELSLLTLNLWNVNPPLELRMSRARTWVGDHAPDLLALQEVSTLDDGATQAHLLAAAAGHDHVVFQPTWRGDRRDQGNAICSRLPLRELDPVRLPDVEGDEPRILEQVEVQGPVGPLRVATTHLAWRVADTAGRVLQAAAIVRALDDCADPLVLAGDLNAVHGSPPLNELAEQGALVDACGDDRPTFAAGNPWTWQPSLLGRRVDHVLLRGDLRARAVEVVLDGDAAPPASDHYGVLARLTLP